MIRRLFLALTGVMFLAFGLWSIIDPAAMTTQLGVEVAGKSGLFEMRGVYGGVSLGAAILCLIGAVRKDVAFAALCFVAAYMGGYVIGRGASLIAGDSALATSWMFAGFELVLGMIALALLLRRS